MAPRFELSQLMGRPVRSETWPEQGVSSLQTAREALAHGDREAVALAVENYVWEGQFIYRSYIPWLAFYLTDGARRFGEIAVWEMLARVSGHLAQVGFPPLSTEVLDAVATADGPIGYDAPRRLLLNRTSGATLPVAAWDAIAAPDLARLRACLDADDRQGALAALETYHRAGKPVHDGYTEWTWLWMTLVADRYGEPVMLEQLAAVGELLRGAALRRQASLPIEELVRQMAMAMRGHRCGPGEEGDITVAEEPQRYRITFDACGSGGRMRRRGELDGLPARQDPPFAFGVVKQPTPASWGRADVPYYCMHCALWSEVMTTDILGYPARITLFDPDGTKPCAWLIYKRPEDIPQEYFDRIGRTRDPARFNRLGAGAPDGAKPGPDAPPR